MGLIWNISLLIVPTPACIVDVGLILSMKMIILEGQNGPNAAGKVTPNFQAVSLRTLFFLT